MNILKFFMFKSRIDKAIASLEGINWALPKDWHTSCPYNTSMFKQEIYMKNTLNEVLSKDSDAGLNQKIENTRDKDISRSPKPGSTVFYQPKVLMYHRIVDDTRLSENQFTCVHVKDFEQQLKLLNATGYTTITFRDYQLYLQGKLRLPKKPIILTFDDGYEDIYNLAYPVMKEQGMKGVVFVLGDRFMRVNEWDRENKKLTEAPLLDNEQIMELHANGFEIGSHTLDHLNLQKLSLQECFKEIQKSKLILEALLDTEVISLSYPYGKVNEKIKTLVKRGGYKFACSVFSGPAEFGEDPFEIRRMSIKNTTTLAGFMMRLISPYEYLEWMWWRMYNV